MIVMNDDLIMELYILCSSLDLSLVICGAIRYPIPCDMNDCLFGQ